MQKTIPATNTELLAMATDMSIGTNAHHATVPIVINTKVNIDADIQSLVDAIMAHGLGRTELKDRRDTARQLVFSTRALLMFGRDSLKLDFGNEFNERWLALGHNNSLVIDADEAVVLQFLRHYKDHLQRNPAAEIPVKNFTAENLGDLCEQLTAARGAVNLQETVVSDLMTVRDEKAKKLRKRVRDVINELDMRLDPLDDRWLAFGLNKPGAEEKPEIPMNVSAILIGPTAASIKWDASSRAGYYRVWMKVHGSDAEYAAMGSPADLDFTLENLPANSTVEIVVSAVNSGGESAKSEVITITTH